MSIELDPITSGFNLSKINNNFDKVENELNNNVLRRDGLSTGETNHMNVNLDMNSHSILNAVTDLSDDSSLVTVGQFKRALRVPVGEQTNELVQASLRAGKLLAFDGSGQPVMVSPISTPTDLAVALAMSTGSSLIGYQATAASFYRTVDNRLRDTVSLHDYWTASDGTNWSPALTRAFADSNKVFVPAGVHILNTTVAIPSNKELYGVGRASVLKSPEAVSANGIEIQQVLSASLATNILIHDLRIEGGCNALVTIKRKIRGVRLIGCTDVRLYNFEINNTADWAFSFERCNGVYISNYRHRKSAGTLYGGRDGLHFLDCSFVYATDLDIESGDDMIGCTTETVGQNEIVIKGVKGFSMIASGVIFNEEGATTFPTSNISVSDVFINRGTTSTRNIVRAYTINTATQLRNVTIKNIHGQTYAGGVWVQGSSGNRVDNVVVEDIDVICLQDFHGCSIRFCSNVRASGKAISQSVAGLFDGWHFEDVDYLTADVSSIASSFFGINLLRVTNFKLVGRALENGGIQFPNNRGGNLLVSSCSAGEITGTYTGSSSISFSGISVAASPTVSFSPDVQQAGLNLASMPGVSALNRPMAALVIKEDNVGTVTTGNLLGCTFVRNGVGDYTITYTTPTTSTFYPYLVEAFAVGSARLVRLASAPTTSSVRLVVTDTAGTPTFFERLNFIAYRTV